MDPLQKLDKEQLRDLICRCWMTHDAMWVYHTLQAVGIEKMNSINKGACRSMAQLEALRLSKALGFTPEDARTRKGFQAMFGEMFALIKAGFMDAVTEFREDGSLYMAWNRCFAYEGMVKLGVIKDYRCGIFDRVEGWFDAFGVKYEVDPKIDGCMMHTDGRCNRTYTFTFPA